MKRTGRFVVAVSLVACMLAAFCGTAVAAEDQVKMGMIIKDPSAPYQVAMVQGAEDEAEVQNIDLTVKNASGKTMKILTAIDNFITQDVDAFILAGAVDLRSLVPGIKRLNEAGIPIATLDTTPEGGKVDFFLSFDIEKASAKAARAFVEGIKERNGGKVPEGVVIEITGAQADMFTHACTAGFNSVIEDYPQLTVAQGEGKWNNTDSHNKTSDLLTRYGDDVLGVYVHTPDIMGSGAVTAIEAAGKDPADYGICGICIGPEGIELIKQGKLLAVVEQPAYDSAVLAVRYLMDKLHGRPVPQIGDTITKEGALWSPAKVVENTWADEGAYIILQGPLVPDEVSADDPRLWENRITK